MEDHKDKEHRSSSVGTPSSKQEDKRGIDDTHGGGGGGEGGGGAGEERGEAGSSSEADTRHVAQSETLGAPVECDLRSNSGQELSEVPVKYSLDPLEAADDGVKNQHPVKHQSNSAAILGQAAQVGTQNLPRSPADDPASSELSPTSVTQSISSMPSPTRVERKLPPSRNEMLESVPEIRRQNCLNQKSLSIVPVLRKPSPDGYNWRKYGQKQVKSPQGSRSYYRCTHSDCYAKKVECSDHTNRVIEIVYKTQHNHNPPHKVSSSPKNRLALSAIPVNGHNSTVHSVTAPNDSVQSTPTKEAVQEMASASETKEQNSSGSDDNSEMNEKEEDIDQPEGKKRKIKGLLDCSETQSKSGKKPKFVVHAAGDVGVSGDGYRWRKYGQKMVKGNPHPRNYYRCTSAGCPVRKHIERAVDSTNAVVIIYKGVHDHDVPVPKKRQGLPSPPLIAAASASTSNLEATKLQKSQNQMPTTKWSVDKAGELTSETLEPGGEKAIDSARTLLSIGFEIKPC